MTELFAHEYIEDLQFDGLRIILSENLPSFTTDSVLLSDFASLKASDFLADLGTGTGILPLLTYGRYRMRAAGFEIRADLCSMARRSFELNGLSDFLTVEHTDVRDAYKKYNGAFSAVVSNPPYFSGGNPAKGDARAQARTQDETTLSDFCTAASRILKSGGRFFCCYPSQGLAELIYCLKECGLEPKRMRLVRSSREKSPYLVLLESRKDGGVSMTIEPDLIIRNADGTETDEIKRIYHR